MFPPGRYGSRREPIRTPRWVTAGVFAVVIGAGLAMTLAMFQRFGDRDYSARVMSFSDVTDEHITGEIRVQRPRGRAATCVVRARSSNGEEVARAEVSIAAGDSALVTVHYTLATSRRPVSFEVATCGPARSE